MQTALQRLLNKDEELINPKDVSKKYSQSVYQTMLHIKIICRLSDST